MNAGPITRATLTARGVAIAAHLWPTDAGPLPTITVKNTRRGWGSRKRRAVTLPVWLFDPLSDIPLKLGATEETRGEYTVYYIAHELCHVLTSVRGHGPSFQARLHAMVPGFYHFERQYKPRAYAQEMKRAASVLA